jgi:hypothetical protein
MDSWFNIPAPAVVKVKSDVGAEKSSRSKVTVAQADVEATAKTDSLKPTPRKPLHCSHAPYNPYPYYGNPYYGNYGSYNPNAYYYSYYAPWNYVYPGQRLTIPFNASSAWYNIPAGTTCAKQASVTLPNPWPPPQPTPMPYQPYPAY